MQAYVTFGLLNEKSPAFAAGVFVCVRSRSVKKRGSNMANTQLVGNIGMYYAAYRLSLLGWNVMPTSRNARGVDVLAYDATAHHFLGIQIKALSKPKQPVPLGQSIETFMGDCWIIVTKAITTEPECFIMKPQGARRTVGFRTGSSQTNITRINTARRGTGSGGAIPNDALAHDPRQHAPARRAVPSALMQGRTGMSVRRLVCSVAIAVRLLRFPLKGYVRRKAALGGKVDIDRICIWGLVWGLLKDINRI